MKRLLVLAAGILQVPVIKKARDLGYYVIAADGNRNAVGFKYADKVIVANITSEEEMLKIAQDENIDGVIHPCSEVSMSVMGRINEELKLHGINRDTAIRATNKCRMRQAFDSYGAPSPLFYCSSEVEEGYSFFQKINGTAILKPSRNSGSRGVSKLNADLPYHDFTHLFERAIRESRDASVMIEQFIEGPEFSVEIIIWQGVVNVLQVTDKKTTGAPYFVELGHSQPSLFPQEVVDAIKDAAFRGVRALGLDNCAAHAEVKYQNGRAYLMEIGARLGGDFISTELTRLSTGIDMVAAAINVALGIVPNLHPNVEHRGVAIRYMTPPPGVVISINGAENLKSQEVYDAEIYVKEGNIINEVKSSVDRSGHVIVTSTTVSDAITKAEKLISLVQIKTE